MRSIMAWTASQTMYDDGSGNMIGPFRGRDVAAGPLLAYTFKSGPKRSPSAAGGFMNSTCDAVCKEIRSLHLSASRFKPALRQLGCA